MVTDSMFDAGNFYALDSTVNAFDENGRLQSRLVVVRPTSIASHIHTSYERDAKGRPTTITRKTEISDSGISQPDRYNITTLNYKPGSDEVQFTYVHDFSQGYDYLDSVVYYYSKGRPAANRVFFLHPPDPALLFDSNSFEVDKSGALTACSLHIGLSGSGTKYSFIYDGKTNPLKLDVEDIQNIFLVSASPGNLVKQTRRYTNSSPDSIAYSYTYRPDGRPASARTTEAGGRSTGHLTYYYQ